MPWVPTTDFEEEVVNLQPHHDFIYGVLSEPQHTYPRPKAHTEYAVNKKSETKNQSKHQHTSAGKMNGKLHVIQQVQRMASTKPVGEQPALDDWDSNKKIEQETIGMMRYCGMGVSVEQPLNEKVTISTYPVENSIKVVQNGRRKVVFFFDDNVFKLKEKSSDTSSGFESCNNSQTCENKNNANDSLESELQGGDSNGEGSFNSSFLSTSSSLPSFSTAGDKSESFCSPYKTKSKTQLKAERLQQYDKLVEDISSLSLNSSLSRSSNSSNNINFEFFETADELSSWKPISEDDENIFEKQENWPILSNNIGLNITRNKRLPCNKTTQSDSTDDVSSEINSSVSSCSHTRTNFLDRFIKTANADNLNTSSSTTSTTFDQEPPTTYATITKKTKTSPKKKEKMNTSSNMITDFQPFYTPRRMYALKRNAK